MPKIKIGKDLMKRIEEYARKKGYSSVEEYVIHTLEKDIRDDEETGSEEEIKEKLKGLGYIS